MHAHNHLIILMFLLLLVVVFLLVAVAEFHHLPLFIYSSPLVRLLFGRKHCLFAFTPVHQQSVRIHRDGKNNITHKIKSTQDELRTRMLCYCFCVSYNSCTSSNWFYCLLSPICRCAWRELLLLCVGSASVKHRVVCVHMCACVSIVSNSMRFECLQFNVNVHVIFEHGNCQFFAIYFQVHSIRMNRKTSLAQTWIFWANSTKIILIFSSI